ncbi:MAG: hypothetical protein CMO21_13285 [Thioclava sp.]|nr:hypothetical protein [Thioclava sp.]
MHRDIDRLRSLQETVDKTASFTEVPKWFVLRTFQCRREVAVLTQGFKMRARNEERILKICCGDKRLQTA